MLKLQALRAQIKPFRVVELMLDKALCRIINGLVLIA
jgi:hypothetical protein